MQLHIFAHLDRTVMHPRHPLPIFESREPSEAPPKNPAPFPEEFWTDSAIHISKLSDREFEIRKDYMKQKLTKRVDWEEETKRPFFATTAKRESCTLPLPEPVPLENFGHNDLIAVFSKMHSRAFVRFHRLCKSAHRLLIKHSTKFNIRLRRGNLAFFSGIGGKDNLWYCPGNKNYRYDIDPTTILPFTFDGQKSYWDGNSFLDVFSRMKWPFTKIELRLRDGSLKVKPWMIGSELSFFKSPKLEALNTVMKELKPKTISHSSDLEFLLHNVEQINVRFSLTLAFVTDLVEKWRSGNWQYRVETIEATYLNTIAGFLAAVSGDHSLIHTAADESITVLVANPSNHYLVLIVGSTKYESARHSINLSIHSNIHSLNDLTNIRSNAQSQIPLDYSGYRGNPDSELDVQAFVELLRWYDQDRNSVPFANQVSERGETLRRVSGSMRSVQRDPPAGRRPQVHRHHPYSK